MRLKGQEGQREALSALKHRGSRRGTGGQGHRRLSCHAMMVGQGGWVTGRRRLWRVGVRWLKRREGLQTGEVLFRWVCDGALGRKREHVASRQGVTSQGGQQSSCFCDLRWGERPKFLRGVEKKGDGRLLKADGAERKEP